MQARGNLGHKNEAEGKRKALLLAEAAKKKKSSEVTKGICCKLNVRISEGRKQKSVLG